MGMFAAEIHDTAARIAAFESALATALPTRTVAAGFAPSGNRTQAELQAGVVNVVLSYEDDYGRGLGRTAQGQATRVDLICHLQASTPAGCDQSTQSAAVRAAELALLAEIKAFCRSNPVPGLEVLLRETQFSRQLEAPMGWLVASIDLLPPVAATH